ncbi:MAG TPA: hypothetical protein VFA04_21565 [Bryobacteraceae bacterium]|nr:hypothetical protein [Bryobacteraceae bacterium]
MARLSGSLHALLLFDVCEEIRLDEARELLGAERSGGRPEFRGPVPEYVRFARPPVVRPVAAIEIGPGETWSAAVRVYEYGVISLALELPFEGDWSELVRLASRWIGSAELERRAAEIVREQTGRIGRALVNPYPRHTTEDYYVVHLRRAYGDDNSAVPASTMIAERGGEIAQIVRGEAVPLSDNEIAEVLREWVSYYPSDLLVVAWMAAFVYDTAEGAAPILELLEYANTELIEFRYYDDLLTRVLAGVYRSLERRRSLWRRWRMATEAEGLNRIRVDVIELTERLDNSIKFLSDMFYARAYRVMTRRIGVNDYRDLVDDKLRIAGDLYQSMIEEFHQGRAFLLEVMVVAILIIELVFLFRGHS